MESNTQSIIPVVILGHNRTMMTIENIKAMMIYIKLSCSHSLHFIIGSDRSDDGHVQAIKFFLESTKHQFDILETSFDCYGLGNMMNKCFSKALEYSNFFIYAENDMILHQKIDIQSYIELLNDPACSVGAINFKCSSSNKDKYAIKIFQYKNKKYLIPIPVSNESRICNFGIGMFSKQFIEQMGNIDADANTDVCEKKFIQKYNSLFLNNSFPQSIMVFDVENYHEMMNSEHGLFYHIGINCQHREGVRWNPQFIPSYYHYLSDENFDSKFRRMFI